MQEEKRKRGRPPKPQGTTGEKVMTYLPPDVAEWLRSQPEGISPAIVKLVRREIDGTQKNLKT